MLNVELTPAEAIPVSPFLARDRSDSYHAFGEDLREFISSRLDRIDPYRESTEYGRQMEIASRPSRWNDEFGIMNVESKPAADPFRVCDRSESYHAFNEDLREFICLRLDRIDPYRESKEYGLQQEKASRLYDRLLELLPEEGRPTLQEYADALGAAHYLELGVLAERAFLDGARILIKAMMNDKC